MVYLKSHLKKYPLMQIEDILKLYLQGILGPAHLVNDFEKAYKRVNEEYQTIKDNNYEYDLFEEISDDYVRIYLKPYFELKHDFKDLVNAFILSSQEEQNIALFIKEIKKLINDENRDFINLYLQKNDFLISHSAIYRLNYQPHYLVIHKKYLKQLLS